jgi:hypothetical protein
MAITDRVSGPNECKMDLNKKPGEVVELRSDEFFKEPYT